MFKTYNTANDAFQMTVEDRLQGWQVQVSYWNGEDFETRYDRYAIAESLWEACFTALCEAGFDSETADWQLAEWEIFPPIDDEN